MESEKKETKNLGFEGMCIMAAVKLIPKKGI
jgi:hypothetical protein